MPTQLDLFDQPIPLVVDRLTFDQAMRLFVAVHFGTKKMYLNCRAFIRYAVMGLGGQYLDTIGRADVQRLLMALAKPDAITLRRALGPSARNKVRMIIMLLFNKYYEWRDDGWAGGHDLRKLVLPNNNPASGTPHLEEPVDDRFFSPWEFRTWIRLAKRLNDFDMVNIIRLGVWLRLSPIDLENLNDDEIDEQNMRIKIYRRHTKTDKNPQGCVQIIPITEKIWGLIQTCKRYRRPGIKTILNFRNDRRRLGKLRKLVRLEGYTDFTWRHLRRTGSGHLFKKGVDFQIIVDGQGHRDPRTTRRYYVPKENPGLRKATEILVKDFDS